jgi:uncharacterized membrane protein
VHLEPHCPKPWNYNPSSWNQRIRVACVALIAVFIALYLGLYQWKVIDTVWDPIFGLGTHNVLTSEVSHEMTRWIRLPDAILGVFAYVSDVIFALAGSERRWQDRPWLVILFGIDVIPLGCVSIILVLLQGFVVKSWCFLCLCSAAISLILIFLAYDEVLSSCLYLLEVKRRSNWTTVWWTFWGYPSEAALEAGEAIIQKRLDNVGKGR